MDARQALLPGQDLVERGLGDLARGCESEASLLVAMAAARLRALGYDVPDGGEPRPGHRLYEPLAEKTDDAHSRYNALIGRMTMLRARGGACAPPLTPRAYSQALSKLERGFDQDLEDVRAMRERGLIDPPGLREFYARIEPELSASRRSALPRSEGGSSRRPRAPRNGF